MSLFEQDEIIEEIRANNLSQSAGAVNADALTDDALWLSIQAAEKEVSRKLRVFLEPTYLLPGPVSQTDLAAVPAGTPWVEEPSYDYDPDLFRGEGWGYLLTRQKPIIQVDYMQFAYPAPYNSVWNLPIEWLRLDKKYGHIRVVPSGSSFNAPYSAWMMSVMGGGRVIPGMIRIRYKAGLENALTEYPDLVDVVKKSAVLRLIEDTWPGSSESISVDGLSQSGSRDVKAYRETVDRHITSIRDSIHGIRLGIIG